MRVLHEDDLALARACLAGDAAAQRTLDRMIRAEVQRACTEMRQPAWIADEVHQELAQKLLVGAEPKLAQYAGESALGRWLGVAASRTALNMIRKKNPERAFEEHDAEAVASILEPELAMLRNEYREDVERAIRAAFEALDSARDRNLLRLYYLDRVGLDQLGKMFNVHASTVSRWLSTLRETIVSDTTNRLAEALGMRGKYSDVMSLVRQLRSELDLTLSRILRTTA